MTTEAFTNWSHACVVALGDARAEIDALNVFPVPDSDTGTNVYLTFVAGHEAITAAEADVPIPALLKTYVDGLLVGAKGNSGVILSQLLRASFGELAKTATIEPRSVSEGFRVAADAAYAAVGRPVEGTILTVARAAAIGAAEAVEAGKRTRETFAAAAIAARAALAKTPEQMDRLKQAGVVDAGGRALVVVLDVTERALTGRFDGAVRRGRAPMPMPVLGEDFVEGGPAYEVMYLLNAADEAIEELRHTLDALGDSLVVVGGDGLWNVHVHVDDVGAAVEAGMAAGKPFRVAVTHFADQIAAQRGHVAAMHDKAGRVVIAAVTGQGLAALYREAGAQTLEFTLSHQVTTAQMAQAFTDAHAAEIIVLPNAARFVAMAEAAARDARAAGTRIAVIPALAQVQGLAALAVHDPGKDFDDDVVAMSSASGHTQHGALTIATNQGMTMAGACEPGDFLGVVAGDFAVVGQDAKQVAIDVLDRIVSPSAEMVTLVVGADAHDGLTDALEQHLRESRPDVDTVVYAGGQENYPLFIAVE